MKRLTGIISLFFCALLMSCSNGISDKTGDINFSFNVEDALRAASLDRATDGSENTANSEKEYIFLVQVKGSKNYYKYQLRSVKIQNNTIAIGSFNGNPITGQSNYDENPISIEDCGDYVSENEAELTFTFDSVPTNQKYKVMFDMFQKVPVSQMEDQSTGETQTQYKFVHVLSGHSSDIQVLRGMQSPVEVDIDSFEYSPISLTFEYEGGGSDNIPVKAISAPRVQNSQQVTSDPPYLLKKYGRLWYNMYGKTNNEDSHLVKDIYYSLDPNSNYPDSSYKYSIPYGIEEDDTRAVPNPIYKEFTFNGNSYSLNDFFMSYSFPQDYLQREMKYPLSMTSPATISKDNFTFIEKTPSFEYESQDEVISGHTSKTMLFTSYQYTEGKAYARVDGLYSYLGGNNISSGESVALVLTIKGNNPLPSATQLYYKTAELDDLSKTTTESLGNLLFNNAHCLNHEPGETRFVIPLNNLNPTSDNLLQLAIKSDSDNPITYTFDIDYYIFPSSMHARIFDIANNRYQIDEYIYDPLNSAQDFTAALKGVTCYFNMSDNTFSPAQTRLSAEVYYTTNVNPFIVVTHDHGYNGTIKQLDTTMPSDYSVVPEYDFVFKELRNLDNYSGYCKFECYTDYKGSNYLLIVRDSELQLPKGV